MISYLVNSKSLRYLFLVWATTETDISEATQQKSPENPPETNFVSEKQNIEPIENEVFIYLKKDEVFAYIKGFLLSKRIIHFSTHRLNQE